MKKTLIFKKNSLFESFLRITIALLLIVTSLISVVMYFYSQRIIYKDLTSYLYSAQNEMCKSMELVINDVNLATVKLLARNNLYFLINDKTLSNEEKERLAREQLQIQTKEYDIIGDVAIITNEGKVYKMNNDEYVEIPSREFLDNIDKSSTITCTGGVTRNKNGEAYVMIGRKFRNLDTGRTNGYLVVYLKCNNLLRIYNHALIDNSLSMLIKRDGEVISAADNSIIGKTIYDSDYSNLKTDELNIIDYKAEKMVVASTYFSKQLKSIGFDWQILTYIKQKNIQAITRKISYNVWIISAISSVIAIVLSFLTVSYILRPLRRLQAAMKGFKGVIQNVQVGSDNRGHDEIWELEKAYVDMVNRIDELIVKNNEEKEKQRELELLALQAQINPHFLYNTLDAIVWLAKIKKQPEIEKITMALAKFFRMSLHKGDKFITVSEEISLVESFVVIEQMRFPSQLQINYNIADDILEYHVLKLILQPVVENALKHGLREKKENGRIDINGMRYDNMIIFEVIDNGKGFDPQMLDEFDNLDKSKSGGYGLKNVDERIKLEYGQEYGMSIYSQRDKGTTVIIKIGIKIPG